MSNFLDGLYEKTDKFILVEADEALYSEGVIDVIEQYFYEMAVEYKSNMYWEGDMTYGCFSIAWILDEKLYLETFSIGSRAR